METTRYYAIYATPLNFKNLNLAGDGTGFAIPTDIVISHFGTPVEAMGWVQLLNTYYPILLLVLAVATALKWLSVLLQIASKWVSFRSQAYKGTFKSFIEKASAYNLGDLTILLVTLLLFVPFFQMAVKQYLPPWVTFFDTMVGNMFDWLSILLVACLILLPIDALVRKRPR